MDPISASIIALIVGGIAFSWWRKFSMALGLILINFIVGVLTLVRPNEVILDLSTRVDFLSMDGWPRLYTVFTAMFLHAGFSHLWSNMLVFLLLGVPFEERIGRARFLGIYFGGGFVGYLGHAVWMLLRNDTVGIHQPLVGASAAVFAILGAFATLYPFEKVYFPIFLIVRMPVLVGAIFFMVFETLLLSVAAPNDLVAHAAHVGGGVGGAVFGLLLGRPSRVRPRLKVNFDRLEALADVKGRTYVQRMRENADVPENARAWFQRLQGHLICPQCQQPLKATGPARLACANRHEERYDA